MGSFIACRNPHTNSTMHECSAEMMLCFRSANAPWIHTIRHIPNYMVNYVCERSSGHAKFQGVITSIGSRVFSRDVVLGGKLLLWGEKMWRINYPKNKWKLLLFGEGGGGDSKCRGWKFPPLKALKKILIGSQLKWQKKKNITVELLLKSKFACPWNLTTLKFSTATRFYKT